VHRLKRLTLICKAFKDTGIHLIRQNANGSYAALTASDDIGYFIYSTLISYWFLFDSYTAGIAFFYTLLCVPFFIMGISFYLISSSWLSIGIIFAGLLRLKMPLMFLNHTYIAYFASFLLIPLFLVFETRRHSIFIFYFVSLIAGFLCSFFNSIRLLSALPVIVFLVCYVLLHQQWKWIRKISFCLLFLIGYSIPSQYLSYHIKARNVFLKEHNISPPVREQHVFWHNIYTGLGFLDNNEGIMWADDCGADRARAINPKAIYPSELYEQTIKNEIFRLCKEKRYFVVTTIFAKLGVILYFFLIYFGWIGVIASWFYFKPWYIELAFLLAFIVSALPGVLTLPVVGYLVGFITCTILYAVYSMLWALNKGVLGDIDKVISNVLRKR
jgi:hypothetical protein